MGWKDDYLFTADIGEHGLCGLMPFLYTTAIVSGLNEWGYEERWCYHTTLSAMKALADWQKHPEWPEPEGWHRHPTTGRRRPEGNKAEEYVNP